MFLNCELIKHVCLYAKTVLMKQFLEQSLLEYSEHWKGDYSSSELLFKNNKYITKFISQVLSLWLVVQQFLPSHNMEIQVRQKQHHNQVAMAARQVQPTDTPPPVSELHYSRIRLFIY